MKKIITYLLLIVPSFFFCTINLFSQSLAVNTDGSVAHSSAILDIKSSTKGMLSPRMTTAQRTAIAAPAAGLFVYDTDTNSFWYYGGTAWTNLAVVGPTTSWLLAGNAATNPNLNFIGTTDDQPLRFRINRSWAGELNKNGNVSFGFLAGSFNSSSASYYNIALGTAALGKNITGSKNIAIGASALSNQSFSNNGFAWESNNIAIGYAALQDNNPDRPNTGDKNIAIGSISMYRNTIGYRNISIGNEALSYNTTGFDNIAIGVNALFRNDSGISNSAIGYSALYNNISGNENTASGASAMTQNKTGSFNSAFGVRSLGISTGDGNTAIGYWAMSGADNGDENTAIGFKALLFNKGVFNTASGSQALGNNTFGSGNTASGWKSLAANSDGEDNTANGAQALYFNGVGNANTANGYQSLYYNSNGSGNTAMGWNALTNNTFGSENTSIGYLSNAASIGLVNATAIGARATVNSSNKMQLGNTNTVVISTSGLFVSLSDGRFKENLKTDVKGLDFIMKLRPVTYNFNYTNYDQFIQPEVIETVNDSNKLKENPAMLQKIKDGKKEYQSQLTNRSSKRETGFVAQEVEKAVKESGYTSFNGVYAPTNAKDNYSLDYSKMVVPLVKAMQEQQQMIDELKKINQDFLRRLEALEKRKL